MKIRCGFVSNSSSSSFVIGIATMPKAEYEKLSEDLKQYCMNPVDLIGGEINGWDVPSFRMKKDGTVDFYIDIDFGNGGHAKTTLRNDQLVDHMLVYLDERGTEPTWDSDTYEYNYYDVDLTTDWFNEKDLEAATLISQYKGEVSVGGGHDG